MGELSSVKEVIDSFERKLKNIQEYNEQRISEMIREAQNFAKTIDYVEEEIKQRNKSITILEENIETQKINSANLQNQIQDITNSIEELDKKIQEFKINLSERKTGLEALNSKKKNLESEEASLTREAEKLVKELEDTKNMVTRKQQENATEYNRLEVELANINKQLQQISEDEGVLNYLASEAPSTPPEAGVLSKLFLTRQISIKEIQESLNRPPSIVTRALHSLEEKGVVTISDQEVKLNKIF